MPTETNEGTGNLPPQKKRPASKNGKKKAPAKGKITVKKTTRPRPSAKDDLTAAKGFWAQAVAWFKKMNRYKAFRITEYVLGAALLLWIGYGFVNRAIERRVNQQVQQRQDSDAASFRAYMDSLAAEHKTLTQKDSADQAARLHSGWDSIQRAQDVKKNVNTQPSRPR